MSGWSDRQARDFAKLVRREVGDGWAWITPRCRKALVAEHVLSVVLGQACESVLVRDVQALLVAVEKHAGIEEGA